METPRLSHRLGAEALGTFWLVFGGCGSAVLAANVASNDGKFNLGIAFVGVALAFGLTVLTMAYAVGHISGGHFNPAVTIGAAAAGRFAWSDVLPYVAAQLVGGIVATTIILAIRSGTTSDDIGTFAGVSNGYDAHSPAGFSLLSVIVAEVVMTAIFLWVILGVTDRRAPSGFAPLAIGLTLTMIHLVLIPVSNASVNPARSIAPAIYGGPEALGQLWVFIIFPIVGALIAGFTYNLMFDAKKRN